MHACGHDAHTAMGDAASVLLERQKQSFSGTVRIIFQPIDEAEPLGGRRVVEEGLLDDIDAASAERQFVLPSRKKREFSEMYLA